MYISAYTLILNKGKYMMNVKYLIKIILNTILSGFYYIFRVFPIQNNKIIIDNYAGKGFGDNGKYIALELLKRKKYDIVWMTETKYGIPEGIRTIPYSSASKPSLKSIYEQATAKIWIDNERKDFCVKKRKKQYYIMTWHGGIGPKKIEREVESQLAKAYVRQAKNDSKMVDLMLAESEYTYHKYHSMFWYNGEILKCGTPRQDILFNQSTNLKKKILNLFQILPNCHVLLYAPTFRNDMTSEDLSIYDIPWDKVLKKCKSKFGGEWVGFIRLHPNIAKLDTQRNLTEKNVYDVTKYPDMQELLSISDIVMTDYSSCIYDFGITGRPGFMIARDIDEYSKQRDIGFGKYGMEVVPFPIARSYEELCSLIENFNMDLYKKNLYKFYVEFCGLYPGGHASEILADRIDSIIKGTYCKSNNI